MRAITISRNRGDTETRIHFLPVDTYHEIDAALRLAARHHLNHLRFLVSFSGTECAWYGLKESMQDAVFRTISSLADRLNRLRPSLEVTIPARAEIQAQGYEIKKQKLGRLVEHGVVGAQ